MSDLIADKTIADASGSQLYAARHAAAFGFQVLAKLALDDGGGRVPWMVVIDATPDEMNRIMQVILDEIRKISGDVSVTLRKTEQGSVILDLEGSEDGFERARSLFRARRFTELAGIKILDVRPWEDLPLIRDAIAGDRRAFSKLFESYRRRVFGYIAARTGEADSASDRTEIEQDTWTRVFEKISDYESSRASFEAFVKYSASLILARYYRTRKRSEVRLGASLAEIEGGDFVAMTAVEAQAIRAEARSIEDRVALEDQFDRLLEVTFGGSSPPHQLLSFAFTQLLDWKPSDLIKGLSERPLLDLTHMVVKQYVELLPARARFVRRCFGPLEEKMHESLDSVLLDFRTREVYQHLLSRTVGSTTLRDYFTERPEDNISHWSFSVRRRALSDAQRRGLT